jgi:hypothetical protein
MSKEKATPNVRNQPSVGRRTRTMSLIVLVTDVRVCPGAMIGAGLGEAVV